MLLRCFSQAAKPPFVFNHQTIRVSGGARNASLDGLKVNVKAWASDPLLRTHTTTNIAHTATHTPTYTYTSHVEFVREYYHNRVPLPCPWRGVAWCRLRCYSM